jgi:hypothetical protein
MGELGDALVAMHGARHRFRSLRATIREWRDGPLSRQAAVRFGETPAGKQSGYAELIDGVGDDVREWQTSEGAWRLWFERPYRLREERDESVPGIELGIREGRRWWMHDRRFGSHSNAHDLSVGSEVGAQAEPLLDPSPFLGAFRFETRGRGELAGREAILLYGKRRPGGVHSLALDRLGDEVSELELAVDAERGVLLRRSLLLDERPYQVTELVAVAFDEPFPAGTFAPR